ncbi:ligase-associated DNA damage response exonuclease [Ancylobacter dichloromethanicus]|uniref:DNA ligase-associated DEXH box helicase n=1 Tax=Ancylobacter dichloromethanicus TaxID=518825 RepID=A0A9W6JAY1_9HYPH|nr:ligase-associated DNA damage response exonuclease [Ancylobacter dichloromethanicus]MBS7555069.1 ligase-associated DNA damage response exonuclease [Ancylobacter dichloromethanicus]GLK72278.1 DNA ligase-associated DEXH box helicase [Ancylobacter dichloromethanicus]
MRPEELLHTTPQGLYSPAGDFFIDPTRPVARALVTHGHSDHARAGHGAVLAMAQTLDIMAIRYGEGFAGTTQAAAYGARVEVNGVGVTFHPAGHILGSAQIALDWRGCTIVASGDYKPGADPTAAPFAPVRCHVFISEATFGLPVFRHPVPADEIAKLTSSLALFPERAHLVGAYALGKAQRVMALLRTAGHDRPILLHGAMERLTDYYRTQGIDLGETRPAREATAAERAGAVVLCPPGALNDVWSRRFPDPVTAFASGWMRIRARARQNGVELPLILSDHADWDELQAAIRATGCEEVWVTHGQEDALVHWATQEGLRARPLHMVGYGEEEGEGAAPEPPVSPTNPEAAP